MAFIQSTVSLNQIEYTRYNYQNVVLTNYTTSAVSAIAANSVVVIGGSVFIATSETSVSGYTAATTAQTVYCKLSVSGTALTAEFTSTAPEYSETYGYYASSAGSATDKYVFGGYKTSNTQLNGKWKYATRDFKMGRDPSGDPLIDGNLSLHNGKNQDRTLRFASDATLLWDESEDEIYCNKSVKIADGIETDGIKLKTKVINMGDWNMDTTTSITAAHGVTLANIRSITAIIRNDANTSYYNVNAGWSDGSSADMQIWMGLISSTNIYIHRAAGGEFDGVNFDSTSYNRGWITITYVA